MGRLATTLGVTDLIMPVFISHKQEDTTIAKACALRLKFSRIPTYLDVLDEKLADAEDITEHFLTQIRRCTHLVAIVTSNTKGSWWVPFGIGAATCLEKRICSAVRGTVLQPEFLSKWPRLDPGVAKVWEEFAVRYRQDISAGVKTLDSAQPSIRSAAEFHRSLKKALGQ